MRAARRAREEAEARCCKGREVSASCRWCDPGDSRGAPVEPREAVGWLEEWLAVEPMRDHDGETATDARIHWPSLRSVAALARQQVELQERGPTFWYIADAEGEGEAFRDAESATQRRAQQYPGRLILPLYAGDPS